ncbi:MAG: phosphate acetyltransferase [Candidatus Cloacimonetes bacterium]|nr:phosphate acetyltransferase [Candidatus Cloacimonadota bacterium]
MIKNFGELVARVKKLPNKTIVIAAAHTSSVLEAAVMIKKENLANALLTGDQKEIENFLRKNYPGMTDAFKIYDTGTDLEAGAVKAVDLVREGQADIIMKGKCETSSLLKAVLDRERGLRTGEIMSDVLAYETEEKIILMGDGGFVPLPDLNQKVSIINNCIKVAHSLGNPCPRVALLTHSEKVNPKIQSTVDAALITQMSLRKQIVGCVIDGPLAFDNAVNREAAQLKGIDSPVAGNADVLIVPNIESGNIFGKALTYYCHYRMAHVAMGARVPILITSRADEAETKFLSVALGIISS